MAGRNGGTHRVPRHRPPHFSQPVSRVLLHLNLAEVNQQRVDARADCVRIAQLGKNLSPDRHGFGAMRRHHVLAENDFSDVAFGKFAGMIVADQRQVDRRRLQRPRSGTVALAVAAMAHGAIISINCLPVEGRLAGRSLRRAGNNSESGGDEQSR